MCIVSENKLEKFYILKIEKLTKGDVGKQEKKTIDEAILIPV